MSRVLDAICWTGRPVVSLFLLTSAVSAPDLAEAWGDHPLMSTKNYRLEADSSVGDVSLVYEYDFEFKTVPLKFEQRLESCLMLASSAPWSVAWFGFEGSFHFDDLLADSIADQIYGVCATDDSPLVVLDDEPIARAAMRQRLRDYRRRLNLG